ncbi:hypothetical protein ETB97_008479 [Aspergillus alliaceus]|uniref:Clr5 domain-containing protein n=1 Tax=Petromyces alliaceus TaxID=209559 RepID=A0A8H5ZXL4_PETAA|nr:hypothetical protein ETB97_008479 [Aspergillus burnettii]
MKHKITSSMWDRKKSLIVRLYQEEEWPLKQVIKRLNSHTFNPSETQLRSRLKKWRITKLSHRRYKRSLLNRQEDSANANCSEEASSESLTPVYSGDRMVQLTTVADQFLTEEDSYSAEGINASHMPPPARVTVPDDICNSFTSTSSVMSRPHEYYNVSPECCPR